MVPLHVARALYRLVLHLGQEKVLHVANTVDFDWRSTSWHREHKKVASSNMQSLLDREEGGAFLDPPVHSNVRVHMPKQALAAHGCRTTATRHNSEATPTSTIAVIIFDILDNETAIWQVRGHDS